MDQPPRPRSLLLDRRLRWRLPLIALGVVGVLALLAIALPGQRALLIAVMFSFQAAMFGVMVFARASWTATWERAGWRWIGIGYAFAGTYTALDLALTFGSELTIWQIRDYAFILVYATVLYGVARLSPRLGYGESAIRLVLDILIIALVVAIPAWVAVGADLWAATEGLAFGERVIAFVFPIGDPLLLTALLFVLVRGKASSRSSGTRLFGLALLLQMVADISFTRASLVESAAEASAGDFLLVIAWIPLLLVPAVLGVGKRTSGPVELRQWAWLPAIAAIATLAWWVFHLRIAGPGEDLRIEAGLVGALVVLVLIRQGYVARLVLDEVSVERRVLLSSVGHELRTPMAVIAGAVGVLSDPEIILTDEETTELLGMAVSDIEYMQGALRNTDLLLDSGRQLAITRKPLDVGEVIDQSLRISGSAARVEVDEGVVARGDRIMIEQALVNLLSNARRYGGGDCLVRVASEGGRVVIEVHDDGPGVDSEFEHSMWRLFERGTHRLDSTLPGTGLGLAIVERVALAHGGEAFYRPSELLGGACFWFTIPAEGSSAA